MSSVVYEKKDRIALITLNRPEAMNALNRDTWDQLIDAWRDFNADPSVWALILTGSGDKAFCAGQDLKEMSRYKEMASEGIPPPKPRVPEVTPLRGMETWKPTIAAVNGHCLAGGFELALACDIRIAAENATFGFSELSRAIIPGGGGTQRLPRIIPFGLAIEMIITGKKITASEAYRLGLVSQIVPLPELMTTARKAAEQINENGPLAVRAAKEAAYRGIDMSLIDGLRFENALATLIHQSEDSKEGPKAFAEKRKPHYKGR